MINKNFTFSEIIKLKVFNNTGSEGILFDYDGIHLLKKYYNISNYSEEHLKEIIYAQKYIERTTLPLGIGYFNDIFIGSILKKFNNTISFKDMSLTYSIKYKLIKLRELLECIQELTNNGLYLDDIDVENVLFVDNKVEPIDLDGTGIIIDKKCNNELLNRTLTLFKTIVLDTLFPGHNIILNNNIPLVLPLSDSDLLNYIMNENDSYEAYFEVLSRLINNKDFIEKGKLYVKN